MLALLSPAKNLDYETPFSSGAVTQPELLSEAEQLIDVCRQLTPADLASLMKLSDKLAGLNAARFVEWSTPFTEKNAKPAVLAFNGDVYAGLRAGEFNQKQLAFAQEHLRILSGLYGVLRPLDLMQPYRLEMGTKLDNERGKNLYEFWGETITQALNRALVDQGDNVVINLASNEYFKSVKLNLLNARVITPVFKDAKNGQYKIISFYAKKARGMMARFMIEQEVTEPEGLKAFDTAGYRYCQASSEDDTMVFLRDETA